MDIDYELKRIVHSLRDKGYRYMLLTLKPDINRLNLAYDCDNVDLGMMLLYALKNDDLVAETTESVVRINKAAKAMLQMLNLAPDSFDCLLNDESETTPFDNQN